MIISFNTGKVETKGGSTGLLQQKKVTVTENGMDVIVPDAGYDGLSTVYVKTYVSEPTGVKDFSVLGYSEEDIIAANGMIDDDIVYTKSLLDAWDANKTTALKLYFQKSNLVYAPAIDTSNVTTFEQMFKECSNLKFVPNYNTSKATSLYLMFNNCENLKNIDISTWDTANVQNISSLFSSTAIEEIDLSQNNWQSLKNISFLFSGCKSLVKVNIEGLNTSKSNDFNSIFADTKKLKNVVGIENLDVSKVTDFYGAFESTNYDCKGVEQWNVTVPNRFTDMFYNCKNIKSLDLTKWKTDTLTTLGSPFESCTYLESLDISTWNLSNLTTSSTHSLGSYLSSLVNLKFGYGLKAKFQFNSPNSLSVESMVSVLNGLYDFVGNGQTPTSSQGKLTLGSNALAKLSDEQKAIATDKGWTLS